MNQISKKYILFEINKGITLFPNEWISEGNNIYKITYTNTEQNVSFSYGMGNWGYHSYGYSGTGILPAKITSRNPLVKVGSLLAEGKEFVKLDSLSEVQSVDNSFYFDLTNQMLYVHFTSSTSPFTYSNITIGVLKRFSNFSGWYDNLYYEGRIQSVSDISLSQDDQYYGILNYDSNSVVLNNCDGYFDNIDEDDIYGQRCRIYFSEDLDFTNSNIYSGFLESFSLSTQNITIQIRDIRKSLEISIPENVYSISQYSNIGDSVNKPIALGYGEIKNAPIQSLNEAEGLTFYTFKICDTTFHQIKSVDRVLVEGVLKTPIDINLSTATITLSSTDYKPGNTITCDFKGYVDSNSDLIENPLTIIKELITNYTDYKYISQYFDITSWNLLESSISPKINLYIKDSTQLIDVINKISSSIMGLFIITQDGKFTYKIEDLDKTTSSTIKYSQLLQEPTQEFMSDSYLSSAKIGYSKRYNSNSFKYVLNTTKEAELYQKYRNKKQQIFETLLTDSVDAEDYATKVVTKFGGIFSNFTIRTKINSDIQLLDIIEVEIFEVAKNVYARGKLLINSVQNNYSSFESLIKGQLLSIEMPTYSLRDLVSLKGDITYSEGSIVSFDGRLKRKL